MRQKPPPPPLLRAVASRPGVTEFQLEPLANRRYTGWLALLASVAEWIFADGPLCVAAPAEAGHVWDRNLNEIMPRAERVTIGRYLYWLGYAPRATPDLLHTLIDSDALYLSPFWLFQASEAEAGVVSDILLKIVSAEPDAWGLSPVTAFRTNPDGDAAEFCSRRFSPSQIDEFLAAQAARNGWRFATAPRDSARPVKGR